MSQPPRVSPVIAAGWPDLVDEFDRWNEAGRVATLWWRDDDAVAPSAALDHLVSLAGTVAIGLAVIPALVRPDLAPWLSGCARTLTRGGIAVLQHGWRHVSHSVSGKKSEFPAARLRDDVVFELAAGRARLIELFGICALPVLVPPWNRFDDALLSLLGSCGLSAISRAKPRRIGRPVLGVVEVNVHVDLVAWAGGRRFVGEKAALGGLIAHMRARRLGFACADEPTGILTHHLIQDGATDAFLGRLLEVTDAHAAARWLDPVEVFEPQMPDAS
jgi:hypothetical protein